MDHAGAKQNEAKPERQRVKPQQRPDRPQPPKSQEFDWDEYNARTNSSGKREQPKQKAKADETNSDKAGENVRDAIQKAIDAIAKNDDAIWRELELQKLKKRYKVSVTKLRKAVDKIRSDEASESGPEVKVEKNGMMSFTCVNDYDDDLAKSVVRVAALRANGMDGKGDKEELPVYTCLYDEMVRLRQTGGRTAFERMSPRKFNSELSDGLYFQCNTPDGQKPRKFAPEKITTAFYDTASDTLPQSPVLIDTPLFADGFKLIQTPGWHHRPALTGPVDELNIFLKSTCIKIRHVSAKPNQTEITKALALLSAMLADFPFLDRKEDGTEWREPSRANALAMLITPFIRHSISGNTPIFMITKPSEGSGATLLAKASMLIFDGKESIPFPYTTNDDEMQKSIVSAILGGMTHFFFDNVTDFNSPCLLKSSTSAMVGGRLLGQSTLVERPNVFQWIATGKNPYVEAEMRRRIVWMRLNTKNADNGTRTYSIPNLEKWIIDNRAELVWSILTLVQHWIAKGSELSTKTLASFGEWAGTVGGILENAGITGFLENRPTSGTTPEDAAQYDFIVQFMKKYGVGAWASDADSVKWGADKDLALDIVEGWEEPERRRSLQKAYRQMDDKTFALNEKESVTFVPSVKNKQPGHELKKTIAGGGK